ncbi:hypothetical protein BK668_24840 [Pseudomonas fluorescens]|nr:hypothetical protein BK668_24840 [Pseudomonas fluorescens]
MRGSETFANNGNERFIFFANKCGLERQFSPLSNVLKCLAQKLRRCDAELFQLGEGALFQLIINADVDGGHDAIPVMTFVVTVSRGLVLDKWKFRFQTVSLGFFQALKSRLVAGFSGTGLVYFW